MDLSTWMLLLSGRSKDVPQMMGKYWKKNLKCGRGNGSGTSGSTSSGSGIDAAGMRYNCFEMFELENKYEVPKCYSDRKGLAKNIIMMGNDNYDDSNAKVEYGDSVTPNPGRVLEVDEGNSSISDAPDPDPSESDDDLFGDDVPTDGDNGSEGNDGDDGISTRRVVDEYEAGNQRIQRDPADNDKDNERGDDGVQTDCDKDQDVGNNAPVLDFIAVVDQQTVPSLVPVVEPDTSSAPSAEPRLKMDPITVETVETALLSIVYAKSDLKKYKTMFEGSGSYQNAGNHYCELQCNKLIGVTGIENTKMENCNRWIVIDSRTIQQGRVFMKFHLEFEIK
jgi:hypothetical protein